MSSSAINLGTSNEIISINAELTGEVVRRIKSDKDIYLSPTGNDVTGDGTSALPYATLRQAFLSIQKFRVDPGKELHIILKNGEYTINDEWGPALIRESDEFDSSLPETVDSYGGTGSAIASLCPQTHPDMDRIVIRGETYVSRPINDVNGQSLTDGSSYLHTVGITTAAGVSSAEDNFEFSLSLGISGAGDSLTDMGVTGGDYLFTRMSKGSTRLSRIGGTNWENNFDYLYFHGSTHGYEDFHSLNQIRDGMPITAGMHEFTNSNGQLFSDHSNRIRGNKRILDVAKQFSYTNADGSGFGGTGAPDTPRQLTRYAVLGSHEISGVSGSANTGTGPGNIGSNHAVNTIHRNYIIDDKNFNFLDNQKASYNMNFYADNFDCYDTPYHRLRGLMTGHEAAVDVAIQGIGNDASTGATYIPNDGYHGYQSKGADSQFGSSGGGYDGCTAYGVFGAEGYAQGISAGGSWGNNLKFTLDPANTITNIGISGSAGEYRKDDKIIGTKYGAVLKLANNASTKALFLIRNCDITIRDLAIVGSYDYTDGAYGVSAKNYAFYVSQRANLNCTNVGIKDIARPFKSHTSSVSLNKVTTGNHENALNVEQSTLICNDCSFTSNWGGNCVYSYDHSNVVLNSSSITGCRSSAVLVRDSAFKLNSSLIMWTNQYPFPDVIDTIKQKGPAYTNPVLYSSSTQYRVLNDISASPEDGRAVVANISPNPTGSAIYGGANSEIDIYQSAISNSGIGISSVESSFCKIRNSTLMNSSGNHIWVNNGNVEVSKSFLFNTNTSAIRMEKAGGNVDLEDCSILGYGRRTTYTLAKDGSEYAMYTLGGNLNLTRVIQDATTYFGTEATIGGVDGMYSPYRAFDTISHQDRFISKRCKHLWDMHITGTSRITWNPFETAVGPRAETVASAYYSSNPAIYDHLTQSKIHSGYGYTNGTGADHINSHWYFMNLDEDTITAAYNASGWYDEVSRYHMQGHVQIRHGDESKHNCQHNQLWGGVGSGTPATKKTSAWGHRQGTDSVAWVWGAGNAGVAYGGYNE